jgi:hypothetical protein
MGTMNEQILREQIIELTKLLELKDMRIRELEALRTIPSIVNPYLKAAGEQIIQVTSDSCNCKKCGSK